MSSPVFTRLLTSVLHRRLLLDVPKVAVVEPIRFKCKEVELPQVFGVGGKAGIYRRKVHYPEEYTIKPLDVTNLGGRDPVTGRVVVQGIGGGIKQKYHWIYWKREGPTEGPPVEEKVLEIMVDWCRTARIALVGGGKQLKYYLASANMKPGDIIKTSRHIPRIPVRPNEGDAYPLGALPVGTLVHNVERYADGNSYFVHAAGSFATILRKMGNFVVVLLPSKREVALPKECMATVGQLSNIEHSSTPIGSPNRSRELGNRPRSGLFKKKTGRFGRKIRAPPPLQVVVPTVQENVEIVKFTLSPDEHYHSRLWCLRTPA